MQIYIQLVPKNQVAIQILTFPSNDTSSRTSHASSIGLLPTIVITSSFLLLPIPSVSLCIHSYPVLYSSFTSSILMATIVFHFDVVCTGKDYQQIRFLSGLSTLHRTRKDISVHSIFFFKSSQVLGGYHTTDFWYYF